MLLACTQATKGTADQKLNGCNLLGDCVCKALHQDIGHIGHGRKRSKGSASGVIATYSLGGFRQPEAVQHVCCCCQHAPCYAAAMPVVP
jgi:hypothetical protein